MKRLISTLLITLTVFFAATLPTFAFEPFGGVGCDGNGGNGTGGNSTVCTDADQQAGKSNPLTGTDGLILKVANIIAVIAGVAAVIIIVLAGLRFIQSGGNPDDVAGARRSIVYASVGLIVIVVSRTLLGLILNALN